METVQMVSITLSPSLASADDVSADACVSAASAFATNRAA
eukprot:CAMPEP_0170146070 /NCGR_PEP_ID=MMETSP0033_2-20121228/27984_1 /TAXON_ID=195969 /ORGANISM="Dolichomastix tenuilepis, Strain CCMP3274" /LENGTH=39 /DNA_ID= /DNA_START= /DNA_END= /DNA_ORIENTATION=